MKNLFLTMIIAIFATLSIYSCSNDSMESTKPEPIQKTSVSNASAKDAKDLTPDQQKEMIDDAVAKVRESRELKEENTNRPAQILCHTSYAGDSGHACVWSNGYLVNVTWSPMTYGNQTPPDPGTEYTGTIVPRCNC